MGRSGWEEWHRKDVCFARQKYDATCAAATAAAEVEVEAEAETEDAVVVITLRGWKTAFFIAPPRWFATGLLRLRLALVVVVAQSAHG